MQKAMCDVRLASNGDVDSGMVVSKGPVSPAEVLVLRAIHGHDAVSNVRLIPRQAIDKTPHADELARLRDFYTMKTEDERSIVDACFPGAFPRLPITFAEVGIDLGEEAPAPSDDPKLDTDGDGKNEVAELKEALKQLGVPVKGNPKLETLRKLYDDAMAAQAAGDIDDENDEED